MGYDMPIYEFYCVKCHTIYNFFSRRIDTETVPMCPRCGYSQLERRLSVFTVSSNRSDENDDLPGDMDEAQLEKALSSMMGEMQGLDEDDPKQAARFMRRLYANSGLQLGSGMEEALGRMEAGEDPEKIEEEMGSLLEQEEPLMAKKIGLKELRRRCLPPNVDDTLYDLK
jgi:putative FmdB family regulatory protein